MTWVIPTFSQPAERATLEQLPHLGLTPPDFRARGAGDIAVAWGVSPMTRVVSAMTRRIAFTQPAERATLHYHGA